MATHTGVDWYLNQTPAELDALVAVVAEELEAQRQAQG